MQCGCGFLTRSAPAHAYQGTKLTLEVQRILNAEDTMAGHTRGTGTTYKRGDVWWLQYFANGRQINQTSGTSNEAEARRQLKVKVCEAAAGKYDVAAFMERMGIPQAHISGLSLGAATGIWLASKYPGKVKSLSLRSGWTKTEPTSKHFRLGGWPDC
jgi:hypothetical protein